jgi:hypothetical protein
MTNKNKLSKLLKDSQYMLKKTVVKKQKIKMIF